MKDTQELESRVLLSSVSDGRPQSIEEVIALAPVSEAGVIQVNAFGLMDLSGLTPLQQSQLLYGPTWHSSPSQTQVEDLYDEGAGAVWGSLSDEGGVTPTSLFDPAAGDGAIGNWGVGDFAVDYGTGDTSAAGDIPLPDYGGNTADNSAGDFTGDWSVGDFAAGDYGPGDTSGAGDISGDDMADYDGNTADYAAGDFTGDWGVGDYTMGDYGPGDTAGPGDNGVDDVADYGALDMGDVVGDDGGDSGVADYSDDGMGDYGPGDIGPGDYGPGDIGPGDYGPGDIGPGDTGVMGTDGIIAVGVSNYDWTIDEQPAPLGLVPPIVAGTIPAPADNDGITYYITGQKGQKADNTLVDGSVWDIGMGTGEVFTRKDVDYEAYKRWFLEVQVSETHGGSTTMIGIVRIIINITDVDEAPVNYGYNYLIPTYNQTNVEGEGFNYEHATHYAAYDPEGVHPLIVTATNLPKGLEFKTREFDADPASDKELFITAYWIEGRLKQDSAGLYHVTITLADQTGHSTVYQFNWEVLNFSLDIYAMTFSNGHEITPDPQVRGVDADPNYPTSYSGIQWLDENHDGDVTDAPTDHQYPYAFHRTQTGHASGQFELENAFKIGAKINIRAQGADGYNIAAAAAEFWLAAGMGTTGYSGAFSKAFDATKYYSAFTLTWQFSVDGGTTWEAAGETVNRLYVLYKAPLITTLFETVVHVSTMAAQSADNTDVGVGNAMFAKFQTRSITRFDGKKAHGGSGPMTYWGYRDGDPDCVPLDSQQIIPDISQLLRYTDGRCGHWGEFFVGMLRTQGISQGEIKSVRATNRMADGSGRYEGLIIKNANFGTAFNGPSGFNWKEGVNFSVGGSILGQGGTPKMQSFSNHALVFFDGKLYDPSYGTVWNDLADFETNALAGLFTFGPPNSPGIFVRKEVTGVADLTID